MKTTTNSSANIKNLTSLWKTAGNSFESYTQTSLFDYCEIKDSQWPNRLWFHQNINQKTMDAVKEQLASTSSTITLPIWETTDRTELLEKNGFHLRFEQIGMSLQPTELLEVNPPINIQLVKSNADATLWASLFTKSFGYVISAETLLKTLNNIEYYIAYNGTTPVGTAVLYYTQKVAGIHSVGIPPEMRRKGYAEQIMKLLMNRCVTNNTELITLQASNMGKNIYLKLGFKEEFVIKNYVL